MLRRKPIDCYQFLKRAIKKILKVKKSMNYCLENSLYSQQVNQEYKYSLAQKTVEIGQGAKLKFLNSKRKHRKQQSYIV